MQLFTKPTFAWVLMLALSMQAWVSRAQTISIAQARATALGQVVTISGIVTCGPELGRARYVQDATAGIGLFLTTDQLTANPLERGDSITITGTLSQFNNLLQLSPVASYTKHAGNRPLPQPLIFEANELTNAYTEAHEGKLIRLNGLTGITTTTGNPVTTFAGNTNYRLNGVAQLEVRVNAASTGPNGLVGKPAPTGDFDVMGIMSQFCSNPATGCTTGYQLLLRTFDDIIQDATPVINSPLTQTNITTTGFTVSFTTLRIGSSKVRWGTTPGVYTDSVSSAALVNNHSLNLTGLTQATVYYVQGLSSNAQGTSFSRPVPMITASLSSGKMIAYFNNTVNNNFAYPGNNAVFLNQLIDDTLIAYINRAKQTLDIAIYNWNNNGLSNITNAVNAAHQRGVRVRVIVDGGSANIGTNTLNPAIRVLKSPTGASPAGGFYALMHNKFVIIDANSANPNDAIVWTGSTNWTADMVNQDPNNVVIIQDQSLAKGYTLAFEEMWGSNNATPGTIFNGTTGTARFGNTKRDVSPKEYRINGKRVRVYFSPSDGATAQIINAINSANRSFQFGLYNFTRNDIAFAARDKFTALGPGNCSFGIVNDTSNGSGPYNIMKGTMGDRLILYPSSILFHHKYLIVDQDDTLSDPLVLTGSMNWSNNGELRSDENTIIIHDWRMANQFYQEFAARVLSVGQQPCSLTVSNKAYLNSGNALITAAPNPAEHVVRLQANSTEPIRVTLTDMLGRHLGSYSLSSTLELNTQGWLKGVYLIQASSSQQSQTLRLIVK